MSTKDVHCTGLAQTEACADEGPLAQTKGRATMPKLVFSRSRPRRRQGHLTHPIHHRRHRRCRGRRQDGVRPATGHSQQSKWRSSADVWHSLDCEPSLSPLSSALAASVFATFAAARALFVADRWQLALASFIHAFRLRTLSPSDCSRACRARRLRAHRQRHLGIVWSLVRSRPAVPVDLAGSASLPTCCACAVSVRSNGPSQSALTRSLSS